MLKGDGTVAGYRQGLSVSTRDLEFSLVEIGEGTIGSPRRPTYRKLLPHDDEEGA